MRPDADSEVRLLRNRRSRARADVVGSLLRPAELRAAVDAHYVEGQRSPQSERRENDRSELQAIEDSAVREAVRRQIDAGLDVVTDGEFRRDMFQSSFWDALTGFTTNRNPVEFRGDDGSTVTWHVHRIEDRLVRSGENRAAAEAAFLAELTDHPFKVTFPAASLFALPFTFKPGVNDHAYGDLAELVAHCVQLERELIAEAVAAGAREVQLDFPAYPYFVDPVWQQAMADVGWSVADALELAVSSDIDVVAAIPAGVTISMHVCRGNNQSRYLCEGPLDAVAEELFSLPYDRFLVEWEDPGRMGGFEALRAVPRGGPTVVLGIVSSKRAALESVDEIAARVDEASCYLPIDQLAISTQCGFASTLCGNELSVDDQWAKLELVAAVADRVWGST